MTLVIQHAATKSLKCHNQVMQLSKKKCEHHYSIIHWKEKMLDPINCKCLFDVHLA